MFFLHRPQVVSQRVILSRKDDSGEMSTTPELQFGEKKTWLKMLSSSSEQVACIVNLNCNGFALHKKLNNKLLVVQGVIVYVEIRASACRVR